MGNSDFDACCGSWEIMQIGFLPPIESMPADDTVWSVLLCVQIMDPDRIQVKVSNGCTQ